MSSATNYAEFLDRKAAIDPPTGIENVGPLHDAMFPHQRDITAWALKRGRSAIFAGTGLGKSLMELTWADVVCRETGKNVLLFAPLDCGDGICDRRCTCLRGPSSLRAEADIR